MYSAVITTEVGRETWLVVTLKLADVAPAGRIMFAGTIATFGLLLKRLITAPPEGAGALSVTIPVEINPPRRLAGLRVSVLSVGSGIRVDVGFDGGVNVGVEVGVCVGVVDTAPIHRVALTFELL